MRAALAVVFLTSIGWCAHAAHHDAPLTPGQHADIQIIWEQQRIAAEQRHIAEHRRKAEQQRAVDRQRMIDQQQFAAQQRVTPRIDAGDRDVDGRWALSLEDRLRALVSPPQGETQPQTSTFHMLVPDLPRDVARDVGYPPERTE
jgi:hypothetical protein